MFFPRRYPCCEEDPVPGVGDVVYFSEDENNREIELIKRLIDGRGRVLSDEELQEIGRLLNRR